MVSKLITDVLESTLADFSFEPRTWALGDFA